MAEEFKIEIGPKEFLESIGPNPLLGNGFMKHCEINDEMGAIGATGSTTAMTFATAPTDDIMQIRVNYNTGLVYAISEDNQLWSLSGTTATLITPGSGTPTTGTVLDMAIYRNCVFVFLNNKIDLYDITNDTWYPDWASGDFAYSGVKFIPNLIGPDDALYFATDNKVNKILADVIGEFDASDSGTWTSTATALDIPEREQIKCMVDDNGTLFMGTWSGANFGELNVGNIYRWDFASTSFDGPLEMHMNGVNQMVYANGLVYFTAGEKQVLYKTDGRNIQLVKDLHLMSFNTNGRIEPLPNGIMFHKGKIYIGTGKVTGTMKRPTGIYSIDINHGNRMVLENTISGGDSDYDGEIRVLTSVDNGQFYIGWRDTDETPDWGIDTQRDIFLYADDSVEYESRLYTVGDNYNPRVMKSLEIALVNYTTDSDQGITVKYRETPKATGDDGGYITIGAKITDSANGPFKSWRFPFDPKLETIQVKVRIDDVASPTNKVLLRRVIIR